MRLQQHRVDPTSALRNSLSVRSEMHHYRLNQHFPKRIREVQLEMSEYDKTMYVIVHFQNGHRVRKPEHEAHTTEFLALCAMLYDLPPKE
jgi:hypothetical protein